MQKYRSKQAEGEEEKGRERERERERERFSSRRVTWVYNGASLTSEIKFVIKPCNPI